MNESLTLPPLRSLAATTNSDLSLLAGILDASSDACWCMEFTEPVDLTAPDHEVVRQVFLNDPRWRFCNAAMARLYLLPPDRVFDDQPVSDIFPRNRQNEEFVLNLIANGFEVDAAPALDRRYDGVQIYVENDVRAHIEDGRLIRMFEVCARCRQAPAPRRSSQGRTRYGVGDAGGATVGGVGDQCAGCDPCGQSGCGGDACQRQCGLERSAGGLGGCWAVGAEAGRCIEGAARSLGAGGSQTGRLGGVQEHCWSLYAGVGAPCAAVLTLTRSSNHV